ncbi:MAG: N-acetylmuramoyl-L-alanine amidase [Crocinitomicaceae bacterium]|nr:N-acetylmuramoyl-L-alanine amidase [Crocinitomicaceae bacterium]
MKAIGILTLFIASYFGVAAQSIFESAYSSTSHIPSGVLEAVSYTNTHMVHLENYTPSCTGLPQAYGIMGLHDNGQNYFRENGNLVAQISGVSVLDQKNSAATQVLAYAQTFQTLMINEVGQLGDFNNPEAISSVLLQLSEIPDSGSVNRLARDMQLYSIFEFMNNASKAAQYNFTTTNFNLVELFGANNYAVLSGKRINFLPTGIESSSHIQYQESSSKSAEFGPAIWNPAATCNFSSRNGVPVSAITIHTIQGSYAGAISWAQNCSAGVSYHYVIRSSDGQVTQMLLEEDKGWHVGTENPYTIGYEHEGYVDDASWYTEEMYTSSADLSRDITNSGYGIPPLRTFYGDATSGTNLLGNCTKIKGHQHYPNQSHTDPGINWDWEKYYRMINNAPVFNTLTATSNTIYDTGGPAGDYTDDEREFWLIQPVNAQSITIDFTVFNIESSYDNLFIYDGDSIDAPLIGTYTGNNSPGIISSSGGSLLIEFRSDCGTVSNGWEANYTTLLSDVTAPTTDILSSAVWHTTNFSADIIDTDSQSGVQTGFYLLAEKDLSSNQWSSNGTFGFAHESFEEDANNWTNQVGLYSHTGTNYNQSDSTQQNSNSYLSIDQNSLFTYLYSWDQVITSTVSNQRAGLHFFCDNPNLPNRGNSYFVYLRENDDKVQLYSVDNDVINLENEVSLTINSGQTYHCKTSYSPSTGLVKVYVNDSLLISWIDPSPLTAGSYISLRTGGCEASFDNIFVYKSRQQTINISASPTGEFSIESEYAIPTGLCKSILVDSAENWSMIDEETFLLDFTPPIIDFLHDGLNLDMDTFATSSISANWLAEDIHSDIGAYEFAIGTLPNVDDILTWTNNGTNAMFTATIAPIYNEVYYVSIRAINQAGLSDQFMSNGQRFIDNLGIIENALEQLIIYPNPSKDYIHVLNLTGMINLTIYDNYGRIVMAKEIDSNSKVDISSFSNGCYRVMLKKGNSFVVKELLIRH